MTRTSSDENGDSATISRSSRAREGQQQKQRRLHGCAEAEPSNGGGAEESESEGDRLDMLDDGLAYVVRAADEVEGSVEEADLEDDADSEDQEQNFRRQYCDE